MVDLLKRLEDEDIESLAVIYHDYSGRSCAKTIPRERFAPVLEHGVVFARATLGFRVDDHQSEGTRFLADTGDFLAVPDPDSYTPVPGQDPRRPRAHLHARRRRLAVGGLSPGVPPRHDGGLRRAWAERHGGDRAGVLSLRTHR